jgi:hypothetical protein
MLEENLSNEEGIKEKCLSVFSAGFEPANLGSNGKHAKH